MPIVESKIGKRTVAPIPLDKLSQAWEGVLRDPGARKALDRLKHDGFPIDHLRPHGFDQPCWADHIAMIPFLPNRASHRHIHRQKNLRKHLPLLKALKDFAAKVEDPFCEIRMVHKKEILFEGSRTFGRELGQAADLVQQFLSSDWSIRERNPRNTMIAFLRGAIRFRTGKFHDQELADIIDAAFSGAGKEPIFLDSLALRRIEQLEMEGRIKAACRVNYVSGRSPTPAPIASLFTRFPRNRKKRD